MSDFYERRESDYINNYSLDKEGKSWTLDDGQAAPVSSVKSYFDQLNTAIGSDVNRVFDVGVGPAAREVLRFLEIGWDAYGCDASPDVVQAAQRELKKNNADPSRIFLQDIELAQHIGTGNYDLITCFNVIQHFTHVDQLPKFSALCGESTNNFAYISILFKRFDFDHDLAEKRGLQFRAASEYGKFDFCDTTFQEWRPYQTFDSDSVVKVFGDYGFRAFANFQPVLRFWNSRKMPCSIITLRK